jgi:seryl-tRNA synthetase
MIDIKLLRKDPQETQKKLQSKVGDVDLSKIIELDTQLREKKTHLENLKAKRNEVSEQIGVLKRKGEACENKMLQMSQQNQEIHALDVEVASLESALVDLLARLPNLPMEDVPVSPDPKDNVCVKSYGEKPLFTFPFKNHLELNQKLHLFDFERGAKITGSGWMAYRGLGARLEWALLNYMIDFHVQEGWTQWMPPIAVKKEILFGAGQLPKFENQQYKIPEEDHPLYLIPTAEVALNGLYFDEILPEEMLPLKYVAYTPCFRREAGAAGAQERGLIRMHQFNKVEMFAFSTPEQSVTLFNEMVRRAERVLEGLGLHYRTMLLVTGDMSFAAARTIDVEVWLPGQNRYYEVSSISNCTDYQSRRSKVRFRRKNDKPELVHTLNGSGLATSRLMVALLENNQQQDGSVLIPKVLQKYMGGLEKLVPTAG